jgi:PTS system nitrogen regulatory IIA component
MSSDLIVLNRVGLDLEAASKKRVLEAAASLLCQEDADGARARIFDHLLERERLGSTGMGKGIALPHARMPGVTEPRGAFLRLVEGVDFSAIDNAPVDLVFGLLVPEQTTQEHLQLLASLARLFSEEATCRTLRQSDDPSEVLAIFLNRL